MISYPELAEALDGLDLVELAVRAGVPLCELHDTLAGGYSMPLGSRGRLAKYLGLPEPRLFHPASSVDADADLEAAFPANRWVRDAETLRAFDGRGAA